MARGNIEFEGQDAPLRTRLSSAVSGRIQGLATGLMRAATHLRKSSQNLQLEAEKKKASRHVWKTLKQDGVPLRKRLLIRLHHNLTEARAKNNAHYERFMEMREEKRLALADYKDGASTGNPFQEAWQAAAAFRPLEQVVLDDQQKADLLSRVQNIQPGTSSPPVAKESWLDQAVQKTAEAAPTELDGIEIQIKPKTANKIISDVDPRFGQKVPVHESSPQEGVWDEFSKWLGAFESWGEFRDVSRKESQQKNAYMKSIVYNLAENDWQKLSNDQLVKVMSYSGISSSVAAAAVKYGRENPEDFQQALLGLGANDIPISERINRFCEVLGDIPEARYQPRKGKDGVILAGKKPLTEGSKMAMASLFLHTLYEQDCPVYRDTMGRVGYKAAGIPTPSRTLDQGQRYVHYLGMLDNVSNELSKRGHKAQDRLYAYESLIWVADGPKWYEKAKKGTAKFPNWGAEKMDGFFAFNKKIGGKGNPAPKKAKTP